MHAAELAQLCDPAPREDYPRGESIHQRFQARVKRTPDPMCVVCEGGQLTYRKLNQHTKQAVHYLQELGVGPEMLVGPWMERSLETEEGLLGILKAGGAYLPLDPAYP
jgi:non-ribosomal peptide synthetase component F